MFAGKYNLRAKIREGYLDGNMEDSTSNESGSKMLQRLKVLQRGKGENFGYTNVSGAMKGKDTDHEIFIREVRDLNNSKVQEYAHGLRPVTSRIYATRLHNEKHCSEGALLKIQNSDNEKKKTYRIVETAINSSNNKELWLYCDRVQNKIEE